MLRLLETSGHAVVEEAATDVIALQRALGHDTPWADPRFIDKVVTFQRQRRSSARPAKADGPVYFDRSPVCTLALSRFLGHPVTPVLAAEIDRITAERIYQPTVFFVRNQGSIQATAERRISYQDSLAFERLHEQAYRKLGFTIADIPAGPLADRVRLPQDTVQRPPGCR
jgi:predicted ATPase